MDVARQCVDNVGGVGGQQRPGRYGWHLWHGIAEIPTTHHPPTHLPPTHTHTDNHQAELLAMRTGFVGHPMKLGGGGTMDHV